MQQKTQPAAICPLNLPHNNYLSHFTFQVVSAESLSKKRKKICQNDAEYILEVTHLRTLLPNNGTVIISSGVI